MLRAAVPEAPVHADGDPSSREEDVDPTSWKPRHASVYAITQALRMEQAPQLQLRSSSGPGKRCISLADRGRWGLAGRF